MAPFPVDPSGGDGQGCARHWCGRDARAPGKPSLCGRDARAPGKGIVCTRKGTKLQTHFGRRVSLKQVHLSSGLFVSIRVHSWFVFINDQPFFLE